MFNGRIKRYELNFPQEMRDKCIADVDKLYTANDWARHLPPFQTWSVLFFKTEEHWTMLRETYRKCILDFTGSPTYHVECWCVASFPNIPTWDHSKLWHRHNERGAQASGIFYISLADGCGSTEFVDADGNRTVLPRDPNCWYIFDSKLYHRPEPWDHTTMKQNRYVIAADSY